MREIVRGQHRTRATLFAGLGFVLAVLVGTASHADPRSDCFGPDRGQRIDACSQLLDGKLNPLTASLVYAMRALAYSLQGDFQKAIEDYDKSLKINPEFPHALNNRAWAYYKLGRLDKATPDVERALELAPRSAHAFDTRAHISQARGNTDEALEDYRRAIRFGGAEIIKLYQCGLQANGLYSGMISGVDSQAFRDALETCVKDKGCDPLPDDEECRKLIS